MSSVMGEKQQVQTLSDAIVALIDGYHASIVLSALANVTAQAVLAAHSGDINKAIANFEQMGVPGIRTNIESGRCTFGMQPTN